MFNIHWVPAHRSFEDRQFLERLRPDVVKVVCVDEKPPQVEDVLAAGAGYLCRIHPMSENDGNRNLGSLAQATEIGRAHAARCRTANDWIRARGMPQTKIWFEGLNEPQLNTAEERPAWVAAYYKAFTLGVHEFGGRAVVGNFGVGWPNNTGPDTPVDWRFFQPVFDVMSVTGGYDDVLGVHEYWADGGPEEMWRWWGGRCLQLPANIRVPIWVTECGIDMHTKYGQGNRGWNALPGNSRDEKAARFVAELWRYMHRLRVDGRVRGIFPFTYDDSNEWRWIEFNLRDAAFLGALFKRIAAEGIPLPGAFSAQSPPPPQQPPQPGPSRPFGRPFEGNYPVTSSFQAHKNRTPPSASPGTDWGTPTGTKVLAVADGLITTRATSAASGRYLQQVTCVDGVWRLVTYRHLSGWTCRVMWDVKKGAPIGLTGNTGNSTGPHFHVDVQIPRGEYVDPMGLM